MTATEYRIGAVILAGGQVPSSLRQYCSSRAQLRVNNKYLLDYLLTALQSAPSIAQMVLVAPATSLEELQHLPGIHIATGHTLVENMQRGAEALAPYMVTHLLFITGDIPLITAEAIEDYLQASLNSGASLTYPIIPKECSEGLVPGAKRTYVHIRDGIFTGGNVVFTQSDFLTNKQTLIQSLYQARKNPLKLAGILGVTTIFRLLIGTLTLSYLEAVATRIMGAPIRAIITRHAEIGFDVDKVADLIATEQILASMPESTIS